VSRVWTGGRFWRSATCRAETLQRTRHAWHMAHTSPAPQKTTTRAHLLLLPSQMCTPLSCSSLALVEPRMNHSSSSSTPGVMGVCA
jgi:hypothetical protein